MPQAVDSELLFDWFVVNKLSVHFGENKTKSILFCPKHRSKSIGQIDISYKDVKLSNTQRRFILDVSWMNA